MHIELSEEIAEQAREAAQHVGIDLPTFVREAVEERLRQNAPANTALLTDTELIHQITKGLPESFWQHYAELRRKLTSTIITETEHAELIALSDQKEAHDVERLRNLIELSKRRQTTVDNLIQEMGIRPRALAA
jgi:tRNA/tmRNA/rRNA uracil-C5-methylase (TrmA/RlmC/RlmD family)